MALPPKYDDYDTYFADIMSFLKPNEFLINNSNVEILSKNILRQFPEYWTDYVSEASLNDLSHFPTSGKGPQPIKEFFQKLFILTPQFDDKWFKQVGKEVQNDINSVPSLNIKKQHEICQLSQIIHSKISECNVSHVIDLGSGLGYLCQVLNSKYGVNVLGVEADGKRVNAARIRQEKYHKSSKNFVKYIQHYVTEQSNEALKQIFNEMFPGDHDFFIVGLHACADLSIAALHLFLNMDHCKGLIIMPCCYHKMSLKPHLGNNDGDKLTHNFENFPLSNSLKRISSGFFQRPFMRLACQRSQGSWELSLGDNHKSRTFHLMCRAVLEAHAVKENGRLVKHGKRKIFNKTLSDRNDFEVFLTEVESNFMIKRPKYYFNQFSSEGHYRSEDVLCSETCNHSDINTKPQFPQHSCFKSNDAGEELCKLNKHKILKIWNDLTPLDFKLATFYTVLQDSLQIICENIVLLDKLAFMKEQNIDIKTCGYVKITNDIISPRCLALLAVK